MQRKWVREAGADPQQTFPALGGLSSARRSRFDDRITFLLF